MVNDNVFGKLIEFRLSFFVLVIGVRLLSSMLVIEFCFVTKKQIVFDSISVYGKCKKLFNIILVHHYKCRINLFIFNSVSMLLFRDFCYFCIRIGATLSLTYRKRGVMSFLVSEKRRKLS